ncbi:MAG TPA: response regulator [Vicinamibacteria bacterium]|nr:response regulator [Vicinamibacteria bacterium]
MGPRDTLRLAQLSLDRAADAVLWVDSEGRLRYANDAACDYLEYRRDDLLALSIFDVDPTLEDIGWRAHWAEVKALQRLATETLYRTRTGRSFPVEANINFLSFRGQEYLSVFAREISERKEAEDALIAITARLEGLIENLPVGILFEDDSRRVVLVNQTLCQMLDIPVPPSSLPGADSRTLLDQCKTLFPRPEQFLDRVEQTLESQCLVKNEEIGLNDGRVLARDYVPIRNQNYRAHLWQYRDVTERKRAEAEILKSKFEAEKANAAKSSFLAMMSHELRTPLNAILGMTELSLATKPTREQREFLRTIQTNSENLLRLIDDVLDLSRIEANRLDIDEIPYDPRKLVEEVATLLNVRAEAKDVELVLDIDPHLPSEIVGDPKRVRQVLVNLVGNAVKFTESGYVLVSVELEDWKPGDRLDLALAVRDTGIGIPEDEQKELFSRFYQADRSSTRRFGGTGLGLNISRSLTNLMGGRIDFTSAEGKGSTFRLTLATRAPRDTEPNATRHRARLAGVPASVFLSIASEPLRRALQRTLKAWGLTVELVDSPSELEVRLEAARADRTLVIVEHDRKRFDPSAWKRLRNPPRQELVLLASMAASTSSWLTDVTPYLAEKPVRQDGLCEAIARALGARADSSIEISSEIEESGRLSRHRILLVEDNPDNRELAARILTSAGASVETAENGAEAVEMARRTIYDLVVMDVMMPVMDGFQTTRAIRQDEQRPNRVPIVALTAHATDGFRARCLESGMDDYLSKPFKRERLLTLVGQWVDRRPLMLVVDDSPENRLIVQRFLTLQGDYRILFAENGLEAFELFARHEVSIVLLDMEMPVVDGFETARNLRRSKNGASVPILAMTAHHDDSEVERCTEAGCTAVLQKPLDKTELNLAVARHLGLRAKEAPPSEQTSHGSLDDGAVVAVDPDLVDLVPGFIENQRANTELILESARAGDFETVRRLGHNMKGTGKGYGFDAISTYGASLERAARRAAETDVEQIVEELDEYLTSVRWEARQ